jgi:hypothetical protein
MKIFLASILLWITAAIQDCPDLLYRSAAANDIGLLSDTVSSDDDGMVVGVCDSYASIATYEGDYATRMRIYRGASRNSTMIVFRPTQASGGDIHNDRRLVPCTFVPGCVGRVHERFQEAFLSLVETAGEIQTLITAPLFIGGHSLGGSLSLFMTIYLWWVYGILPVMSLGIAGPMIGDAEFSHEYQRTLHQSIVWWQIESADRTNRENRDGTIESYNTDPPEMEIDTDAICLLLIDPLPSYETYGMHDLKNYRVGLVGVDAARR